MQKSKLSKVKRSLTMAADHCVELRKYVNEIADGSRRSQAEQILRRLEDCISDAREEMKDWKTGYPKGRHRIEDDKLEAIRQWKEAPFPKPKVRALAARLGLSPTTVYTVLKRLGWKKKQS